MNYIKGFLCGCRIKIAAELCTSVIEYCPKHKAAPEAYEVLLYGLHLDDYIRGSASCPTDFLPILLDAIRQVLAKVEGRNNDQK